MSDAERSAHVACLLDSYRRLLGIELIARSGDAKRDDAALFAAPFVVLSHGVEADPLFNYANAAALQVFEMTAAQLIGMPSRLSAEPMNQAARARFLEETRSRGYATGYEGVRISATGRRFRIEGATLWTVSDSAGRPMGQAATFSNVTHLP